MMYARQRTRLPDRRRSVTRVKLSGMTFKIPSGTTLNFCLIIAHDQSPAGKRPTSPGLLLQPLYVSEASSLDPMNPS